MKKLIAVLTVVVLLTSNMLAFEVGKDFMPKGMVQTCVPQAKYVVTNMYNVGEWVQFTERQKKGMSHPTMAMMSETQLLLGRLYAKYVETDYILEYYSKTPRKKYDLYVGKTLGNTMQVVVDPDDRNNLYVFDSKANTLFRFRCKYVPLESFNK